MKSVLISVQPQWCEKITRIIGQNGTKPIYEKSVEIRKTRPKIETPFKCYIYCTLSGSNEFFKEDCNGDIAEWNKSKMALKKGKVIGEFVCRNIYDIECSSDDHNYFSKNGTCLTVDEIIEYCNGKDLFGWEISDLVIYDKPKELSEFRKYISFLDGESISELEEAGVTNIRMKRPPQSWCYVEGVEEK